MSVPPSSLKALEILYRTALRLYPSEFRARFAPLMLETFHERAAAQAKSGWLALIALMLSELFDVARTAHRERKLMGAGARRRRPRRHDAKRGTVMEIFLKDVRHAARSLVRSPMFAIVAILSLSLGIGANTAIFSLVDGALLRPMPVDEPDRLVALYGTRRSASFPQNFSYPNFEDFAERPGPFTEILGFQGAPVSLDFGREPELVWSEMVTSRYFTGLGVAPALGRTILPEEATIPGNAPVTVLSYAFWQRRFQGDEGIVGEKLRLNGHEFTVVGVAARGFTGAKFLGFTPDLWVPITMHAVISPGDEELLERRRGSFLNVRARIAPGVSLEEAQSALDVAAGRLEESFPDVNRDLSLHLIPAPRKTEPFLEVMTQGALPVASGVLFAIVGIVLLLACANVASLHLARAISKERELAVRLSLGATRVRLVRQLLLESLLVALTAGALGLWLAKQLLGFAERLSPALDFAIDFGVALDARVLAFTFVVSIIAGVVSGVLPAARVSQREPVTTLKEASGDTDWARWTGRRWIVVPQIALSLVALVAAGLLVASFRNVSESDPGFATRGILLSSVNLELQGYDEARGRTFYRDVVARLAERPEVGSVSLAFPLPLDAYTRGTKLMPAENVAEFVDDAPNVFYSIVDVGYFETIGTALLHGRGFTPDDDEDSRPVAIVNKTLAERFWPSEIAIGKRIRFWQEGEDHVVVGVARDGKYLSMGEKPEPYLYLPLRQNYSTPMAIVAQHRGEAARAANVVRDEIRALDPTLPVYGVNTIGEFLERTLAGPRALAVTVSSFGVLAVVLATIGVYGLMSFSVSRRRHELGIRMALGATKRDVLTLFLRQTLAVVVFGLVIGLVVAWLAARAMSGLLYGVSPSSLGVYGAVASLLGLLALVGGFVASRRATELDPIATLRHD